MVLEPLGQLGLGAGEPLLVLRRVEEVEGREALRADQVEGVLARLPAMLAELLDLDAARTRPRRARRRSASALGKRARSISGTDGKKRANQTSSKLSGSSVATARRPVSARARAPPARARADGRGGGAPSASRRRRTSPP